MVIDFLGVVEQREQVQLLRGERKLARCLINSQANFPINLFS